ncbi:MAG: Ig-like domain-containing protein [Candidatus Izemoplasmatales bacterium]|jgi:hypothetical protein|nr:Ig-like domain-containing protein [Candidatus Izemoplasmatales bacterium]
MKRILSFLLITVAVLVFAACNGTTTEPTTDVTTLAPTTVAPTTVAPTTEVPTTEPVALTALQIIGNVEDYYFIDDEIQLGVMFTPVNATNKSVTWSSSDETVATVDQTGLVVCVGVGTTTITVAANSNPTIKAEIEIVVADDVLYGITTDMLNQIPAETNLSRWDVAWGDHPGEFVGDLFDLTNTAELTDVIWRQVNPKSSGSILADAGYGAILNVLETEDDDTAGLAIYNKVSLPEGAESLQVIARGTPNGANGGDPNLSGRGMFRVSLLVPGENGYELNVLTQTTENYPQDGFGWITFEEPPVVDQKDAFLFDITEFAGIENVIVVIEGNDRLDIVGPDDTNLADRVIILAVRIITPEYVYPTLTVEEFEAIANETNLARWDFAWGGQGASASLIDYAGTALPTDTIWRTLSFIESSVIVDAGYGAVLNAFETADDTDAAVAMYNKTNIPANAEKLVVVARGQQVADTLSGQGQFRVLVYHFDGSEYIETVLTVELTASQVAAGMTQDANGYVTFDLPPAVDVDDAFTFDLTGVAGKENALFVIEANDRLDTTSSTEENLADRVLILAVRINLAPDYVYDSLLASDLDALAKETNLARWDFAWGGQGATTTLIDFGGTAVPTDLIWRTTAFNETSVVADAGYGAILNAFEAEDNADAALGMYNKTDISALADKLVVVARGQQVADTLSGQGQFRVRVFYKDGDVYVSSYLDVELTASQVAAGITQDANGYVTFDTPPTIDVDDLFTFDLAALNGITDAIFVIEANDRMDTTGSSGENLADRVLILAVRIIEAL